MTRAPQLSPDVLDEACEVFWRDGYPSASISRLVRSTALNRHMLYKLFGSKWALAEATLWRYLAALEAEIRAQLAASALDPARLAAGWRRPEPGSYLARVRARGCYAASLLAEARAQAADLDALRTEPQRRLRAALARALPAAPAARLDLLAALLHQALVSDDSVDDLEGALRAALAGEMPAPVVDGTR